MTKEQIIKYIQEEWLEAVKQYEEYNKKASEEMDNALASDDDFAKYDYYMSQVRYYQGRRDAFRYSLKMLEALD